MQLKRLYMKNFLCVGESPVEILFPQSGGITLIRGTNHDVSNSKSSNAAGKSTVIEGILFALYGETLRALTLPNIPNTHTKGDCLVELEYDNVKIVRELVRKKKKVEHHIVFTVDDVAQGTNASVPEIQKNIQRKIAVNFATMCNILIFGQHNMVSFLDAGEPEKREIVESLMNLEEYNAYEQRARDMVRQLKTEIEVLSESHLLHLNHLGEQIALRAKQEKALDEYREKLSAEIKEIHDRIVSTPSVEFVKKEWERYNADTEKKQAVEREISNLQTKRAVLSEDLSTVIASKTADEAEKQPLLTQKEELTNKLKLLESRRLTVTQEKTAWIVDSITIQSDEIKQLLLMAEKEKLKIVLSQNWDAALATLANQITDARHRLESLDSLDLHDETCPTCFGKVDPANIENVRVARAAELQKLQDKHKQTIADKQADIASVQAQKAKIDADCSVEVQIREKQISSYRTTQSEILKNINQQAEETKQKIEEQLAPLSDAINAFNQNIENKYAKKIATIEESQAEVIKSISTKKRELYLLENAKKPTITMEELGSITARLESDRKLYADKVQAHKQNPYADIIRSLSDNISDADNKAKDAEKRLKEKEKMLPYYEWWVTHFGKQGIKSYVIDQIIPTLNEQIEYWMQIIYQGTISVRFDKFLNVTMINNASKNEMVFGQGSGGERRRVDLAIMLAFRQIMQLSTGRSPSILFFDEVAENLDEDGVYRLYDMICDTAKSGHVYVITHNTVLLGLLQNANILQVEKRGGVTKISA